MLHSFCFAMVDGFLHYLHLCITYMFTRLFTVLLIIHLYFLHMIFKYMKFLTELMNLSNMKLEVYE